MSAAALATHMRQLLDDMQAPDARPAAEYVAEWSALVGRAEAMLEGARRGAGDPWERFLSARRDVILGMRADGESWARIAAMLSMDPEQPRLIAESSVPLAAQPPTPEQFLSLVPSPSGGPLALDALGHVYQLCTNDSGTAWIRRDWPRREPK